MPVPVVLLLGELALGLSQPFRVLHADLLHWVVHELLGKQLPHHPVDDLLVVLLLPHLLELAHHLRHDVLAHRLNLVGLHPFEVCPCLAQVVQELVHGAVGLCRVLVVHLEFVVQVVLDGVDALHRAAQRLQTLLQGVAVHRVLKVRYELVHGVRGLLLVLVLEALVHAVALGSLGLVTQVDLLLLLLLLPHSSALSGIS
mmetsp:Transcript_6658/g.12863  ORF Transcript_6658/g.12863 Transcript_6658/m.12863 type:complete len:200 (+) Transcript_6658:316-915(+)